MNWGGLQGVRTGLAWGMTSTLRTVPAAGDPGKPEISTLTGPEAFNLTLAGLDQSGRGGGTGLSFFCCCVSAAVEQGELEQPGAPLSSELAVALDWGPSFTPLMRSLRCSRLSWTTSCLALVWVGVFLVGRRAEPGLGWGLRSSGGLTGCCLERATWLLTYFALSASSLSTALCFGLASGAGHCRPTGPLGPQAGGRSSYSSPRRFPHRALHSLHRHFVKLVPVCFTVSFPLATCWKSDIILYLIPLCSSIGSTPLVKRCNCSMSDGKWTSCRRERHVSQERRKRIDSSIKKSLKSLLPDTFNAPAQRGYRHLHTDPTLPNPPSSLRALSQSLSWRLLHPPSSLGASTISRSHPSPHRRTHNISDTSCSVSGRSMKRVAGVCVCMRETGDGEAVQLTTSYCLEATHAHRHTH